MPKSIIAMLNAESRRILAMQEVKDKLTRAGIDAAGGTPEDFGKFTRAEFDKWGLVVKAAGCGQRVLYPVFWPSPALAK